MEEKGSNDSIERSIIGYANRDTRAIGDKSAQLVIRHNDCSSTLIDDGDKKHNRAIIWPKQHSQPSVFIGASSVVDQSAGRARGPSLRNYLQQKQSFESLDNVKGNQDNDTTSPMASHWSATLIATSVSKGDGFHCGVLRLCCTTFKSDAVMTLRRSLWLIVVTDMASQTQLRCDSKVASNTNSNRENAQLFRATHTEGGAVGINVPDVVLNVSNDRLRVRPVLPHKQAWYPRNYKDEWTHSNIFVARMAFLCHWLACKMTTEQLKSMLQMFGMGTMSLASWSVMLDIMLCRFLPEQFDTIPQK
jgi:hypothetical protein